MRSPSLFMLITYPRIGECFYSMNVSQLKLRSEKFDDDDDDDNNNNNNHFFLTSSWQQVELNQLIQPFHTCTFTPHPSFSHHPLIHSCMHAKIHLNLTVWTHITRCPVYRISLDGIKLAVQFLYMSYQAMCYSRTTVQQWHNFPVTKSP